MKIVFTEEAEHDLKRIGNAVAGRIVGKILWFGEHFTEQIPQPLGHRFKGLFKLRVGDWRVVYEVDYVVDMLIVHLIDHRSKIYERK